MGGPVGTYPGSALMEAFRAAASEHAGCAVAAAHAAAVGDMIGGSA